MSDIFTFMLFNQSVIVLLKNSNILIFSTMDSKMGASWKQKSLSDCCLPAL